MVKIAFGQVTYDKDFEDTKLCIQIIGPFVDSVIIAYDQTLNEEQIKWLEDNKSKYNLVPVGFTFKDDFPAMRNVYLEKAKELGINWLCVSDPDELYDANLAKNLRYLIERYDKEGYSILGVNVKDQFQPIGNDQWFDELDMLKEWPAGLNETDYYKPMLIFKLFSDIRYEGVGVEKKVHETLLTQYKQKTINLPKEYFYVHTKSAIKIWRNAARNLFISGGGDNEGSKNRLWTDLRRFCGEIGINAWNEFEFFVNMGINKYSEIKSLTVEQKKEFRLILEAALKSLPTKYGTENREMAKWYLALHQDELDEKLLLLIKTVPEATKESELENFVTSTYYQILGRHPDRSGLDLYVQKIMNKELKRHELADIFRNSMEHKEKFGGSVGKISSPGSISIKNMDSSMSSDYKSKLTDEERIKYDKIQKFVEQMYTKVLGRPADSPGLNYYTEAIMKKHVRPVDLPDIFRRSEEYSNLHGPRGKTIVNNIVAGSLKPANEVPSKKELKMINLGDTEGHDTIGLCIMGVRSELGMIKESIMTMKDVVDEIHVQTDDFTEENIRELKRLDNDDIEKSRIKIHFEKWKDDFSDYKNRCYGHATTEWILILDADEIPTKEMADNLKDIINNSNRGIDYDMVSFDVVDTITVDRNIVSTNRNKGGKALLHWNIPGVYYGDLHIWVKDNYYPFKSTHSDIAYKHMKDKDSILERSARNVVIGGGGDTVKDKNNLWVELSEIRKELGLDTWKKFNDYLKKGNIDIRIIENFQKQSEKVWKDEELMDLKKYYLKLHPKEEGRF